jgi:predicted nucleotidyltransferase
MTLDELRQRRPEIERIAERHGARNVRVFGSVARGDAVPGSDVDFVVDLDPDRTVLDLSALILDLQAAPWLRGRCQGTHKGRSRR